MKTEPQPLGGEPKAVSDFKSHNEFYDFVRTFSYRLRDDGLEPEAEKLRHYLDEVAWTTSSELFGELGRLFLHLDGDAAANLTPARRSDLQRLLRAVRRVWPDLK